MASEAAALVAVVEPVVDGDCGTSMDTLPYIAHRDRKSVV